MLLGSTVGEKADVKSNSRKEPHVLLFSPRARDGRRDRQEEVFSVFPFASPMPCLSNTSLNSPETHSAPWLDFPRLWREEFSVFTRVEVAVAQRRVQSGEVNGLACTSRAVRNIC